MRCYLFAICQSTAIDRDTNNFSLFNVFEVIQLFQFEPGQVLPLQSVIALQVEATEMGREIEMRTIWLDSEGTESSGVVNPVYLTHSRIRIRSQFLRAPASLGSYELRLEWRWKGDDEWHRENVSWPLILADLAVSLPPQPSA